MILRGATATTMATMAALGVVALAGAIGGYRLGVWVDESPGPGLLPLCASAMLLTLVAARVFAVAAPAADEAPTEHRRLALYILGLVLFGVLFAPLGLPLAALAALLAVLIGAERMAVPPALLIAVAMILGVLLLFDYVLAVPLPWGPLAGLRIWGP